MLLAAGGVGVVGQARLSLFRYLLGITRVVLLIYLIRYLRVDDPI